MGMFVAFGNAFLKTKRKSDSWDWAVHARSLADAALGWRWECLQLSNGFPEATIQVWSFIGDGMAVKGKRRGMIEMRIALNGRIGDGKCHRNFLLNKKGLSLST